MKLTGTWITALLASTTLLIAPGSSGASAEAPAPALDRGLAAKVATEGLCRDTSRYRLVLANDDPARPTFVRGRMTIRDAPARSRWSISTLARTTFADGSQVTGTTDAIGRANKNGTLRIEALTRAGARHEFEFIARTDAELCYVNLRA